MGSQGKGKRRHNDKFPSIFSQFTLDLIVILHTLTGARAHTHIRIMFCEYPRVPEDDLSPERLVCLCAVVRTHAMSIYCSLFKWRTSGGLRGRIFLFSPFPPLHYPSVLSRAFFISPRKREKKKRKNPLYTVARPQFITRPEKLLIAQRRVYAIIYGTTFVSWNAGSPSRGTYESGAHTYTRTRARTHTKATTDIYTQDTAVLREKGTKRRVIRPRPKYPVSLYDRV